MKKVGAFIKKHVKKFIGGAVALVLSLVTFGLLNVYKSNHEEEEA